VEHSINDLIETKKIIEFDNDWTNFR